MNLEDYGGVEQKVQYYAQVHPVGCVSQTINRAPVPTINTMFLHRENNSAFSIEQWKTDASSLAATVSIRMMDDNALPAVPQNSMVYFINSSNSQDKPRLDVVIYIYA